MNRLLEKWMVFLKEDLKITKICKSVRENLVNTVTNEEYFSKELTGYLKKTDPSKPYIISETDPAQVAVIKKLINALEHVERVLRAVEDLDISRERSLVGIGKDIIKISYQAIQEIYAAMQLINHSSADIQHIVGPHLQVLLPKIALATEAIGKFAPEHPEQTFGASLGQAIGMLPTEKQTKDKSIENLSNFIISLPSGFKKLHKLIATDTSVIPEYSKISGEAHQEKMQEKANELEKYFMSLSNKDWGVTARGMPKYFSIMKLLETQVTSLIKTATPLTTEAYKASVRILEYIKHEIVPQLISQLEQVEESMGLKPGLLTDEVLKEINKIYAELVKPVQAFRSIEGHLDAASQLMTQKTSEKVAKVAKVALGKQKFVEKDNTVGFDKIDVMMDAVFDDKRRSLQINRLSAVELDAEDNRALHAAEKFFKQLGSYYSSVKYRGCLANLSQNDKKLLIDQYKQFQPYFAAVHPDIDKLIVVELTKPTPSILFHTSLSVNEFNKVLACEKSVVLDIVQNQEQAKFKAKLVRNTMSHAENTTLTAQSSLTSSVRPFEHYNLVSESGKPSEYYREQAVIITVQMKQIEVARHAVTRFFEYISKNSLNPSASFSELSEVNKEFLRKEFKKFQSLLLSLNLDNKDEVCDQLVSSLNSSTSTASTLTIENLQSLQKTIESQLTSLHHGLKVVKSSNLQLETSARIKTPLVALGTELEKQTLFGAMSELKLSKSIDEFLNTKFKTYLENNLSPVLMSRLDFTKVPFLELHQDSSEVVMYKQLINSIYYLKNGLEKLETLNNYGDPQYIVNRTRFIMTTANALLLNFKFCKRNIMGAMANPVLKDILQVGLELLAPLEKIPVLGEYLKIPDKVTALTKVEDVDIIKAWEDQLAVVKSGLTPIKDKSKSKSDSAAGVDLSAGKDKPKSESVGPETPVSGVPVVSSAGIKVTKNNYQQWIPENLEKIQVDLNKLKRGSKLAPNSQEKTNKLINDLVNGLKGFSYDFNTGKKIIKLIKQVQTQITNIHKKQQELTPDALGAIEKKLKTILSEAKYNHNLRLLAKKLYQIPVDIHKLKKGSESLVIPQIVINKKIDALVANLSDLSFGPKTLNKILNAISKVQIQLSLIAKQGRQLTMSYLKEIQSELATTILMAADDTEFRLGLKPGTYSKMIGDVFDKFYSSLLVNLPIDNDQDAIELLINTEGLQNRKKKEEQRLIKIKEDNSVEDSQKVIFGTDYKQFNQVYEAYKSIKDIISTIDLIGGMSTFLDKRAEFAEAYAKIQPQLVGVNEIFKPDYISGCKDDTELEARIAKLFEAKPSICKPMSSFEKLKDLYLVADFTDEQNQRQFLQLYKDLQPHLNKINYKYNLKFFLRQLQTPQDFEAAIETIVKDESKLNELVQGLADTKNLKIKLCEERIAYIELEIANQKNKIAPEKIQVFKEKLFNTYMDKTLKSILSNQFGPYAELIFNEIKPSLLAKQAEIIKGDNINKVLAEETDKIIAEKIEVLKYLVFVEYIKTSTKNQLSGELGIYVDEFIKQLVPQFIGYQSRILNDIPVDEISTQIPLGIDKWMPEILGSIDAFKKAYVDLNNKVNQINKLLEDEKQKPSNPCRTEKIAVLENLLIKLQARPKDTLSEALLKELNNEVERSLDSLKKNDVLISYFEQLESLESTSSNLVDLQKILADTGIDASQRVAQVESKLISTHLLVGDELKKGFIDSYINAYVEKQKVAVGTEYGTVVEMYLDTVRAAIRSELLPQLAIGAPEENKERCEAVLNDKVKDLLRVCKNLNSMQVQINGLIEEELERSKERENPCRLEKAALLISFKADLESAKIPEGVDPQAFLSKRFEQTEKKLITLNDSKLSDCNKIIELYDRLVEMKQYVEIPQALKAAKIIEIDKMLNMLKPREPVAERLAAIEKYANSPACQTIILKSSESAIGRVWNAFLNLIGQGNNKQLTSHVSSFKQRLDDMKKKGPTQKQEKEEVQEHEQQQSVSKVP